MNYSGIDLHSNNSVVTVTDETDRVLAEKRLPNDLPKILAFLAPWRAELAGVVVESTFNWYWLVDGLQEAGFNVHLANTTAIKKYDGLKHSGDETDARYLAHLLRLGILRTGTILPPQQRAVRDLARKRMQLVRSRTSHILAVENITARQFGKRITSNQVKRLDEESIKQMHLPNDVALAVRANVAVITTLCAQIGCRHQQSVVKRCSPRIACCISVFTATGLPGARFHPDQARRTVREVFEELCPLDRLVHDLAGFLIDVMQLEHVFRDVHTNCCTIHHWILRSPWKTSYFPRGHIDAVGPVRIHLALLTRSRGGTRSFHFFEVS